MSRYERHFKWKQRQNPVPQLKKQSKKRSVEDVRREKEIERKRRIFEKTQKNVQYILNTAKKPHKKVQHILKTAKKPKQSSVGFNSQFELLKVEADGHCFYHSIDEALGASNVNLNPPTARLSPFDKSIIETKMAKLRPLLNKKFSEFANTTYIPITDINKKRRGAELRLKVQLLFQQHFDEIQALYQTVAFLPVRTKDLIEAFTWDFQKNLLFSPLDEYVDHQIVAHAVIYLLFKDLKIYVYNKNDFEDSWEKYWLEEKIEKGNVRYVRKAEAVTGRKVQIKNSIFLLLNTTRGNGHYQPYVPKDPKQEFVILS